MVCGETEITASSLRAFIDICNQDSSGVQRHLQVILQNFKSISNCHVVKRFMELILKYLLEVHYLPFHDKNTSCAI